MQPTSLHCSPRAALKATRFVLHRVGPGWGPSVRLLGVEGISLRAEAAGGGAIRVEVAAEGGHEEGAEDKLSTPKRLSEWQVQDPIRSKESELT